ncbi:hypothetical protein STEG23_015158, partial [Scotinomys teguina]
RTWKQPRCPSTKEWIRKMWYIYTMEYYAAEKNNDIMKFAGKWMELENVILSEHTPYYSDSYSLSIPSSTMIPEPQLLSMLLLSLSVCITTKEDPNTEADHILEEVLASSCKWSNFNLSSQQVAAADTNTIRMQNFNKLARKLIEKDIYSHRYKSGRIFTGLQFFFLNIKNPGLLGRKVLQDHQKGID